MTKLRSLSFAASLMAASMIVSPAFAIDLGGGLGGNVGGAIGPSGIGGTAGGTVNGTVDPAIRTGGHLGDINDRANGALDREQDRAARRLGAIEVPESPSADELNSALKAAGYADAALETPVGDASGSGSADSAGNAPLPTVETPALPDGDAAIDAAQSAKDAAVARTATALPSDAPIGGTASAQVEGEVSNADADGPTDQPADGEEASDDAGTARAERARPVNETAPSQK